MGNQRRGKIMTLADFARCDIDAMNDAQLTRFARAVGEESIPVLRGAGGRMNYSSLVAILAEKTALDASEIAFGIVVASSSLDILRITTTATGRVVSADSEELRVG